MKPKVYYGLHMHDGIAEYREPDADALRVLVRSETAMKMDPSFAGCPIYIDHVDDVNWEELHKSKHVGLVSESFFNAADGKHWVKFIISDPEADELISKGWALSNAYYVRAKGPGGNCQGVDYEYEVTQGEYEHLAIVNNPRYETRILKPEDFKAYNEEKIAELKRLTNSKEEKKGSSSMKLKFFKRSKIENSLDIEGTSVELKDGQDLTIAECVELAEKQLAAEAGGGEVSQDQMVKVADGEITLAELISRYNAMVAAKQNSEADDKKKKEEEEKKANESKEKAEKEKAEKEAAEKQQNSFFHTLQNASSKGSESATPDIDTRADGAARGRANY